VVEGEARGSSLAAWIQLSFEGETAMKKEREEGIRDEQVSSK